MVQPCVMLKTPIYRYPPVFFLLALVFNAAAFPQNDGSYGTDILPDQSISWRAYDGYFVLRPCLKSMFDGGQIAKNVDCTTNSCLCDKANLDSNMAILSSEVPKTCTDIRAVDIPHATSVLGGYCAKMKTDGSPNSAAPTTGKHTHKPSLYVANKPQLPILLQQSRLKTQPYLLVQWILYIRQH